MKLLFVMKSERIIERTSSAAYNLCKNDNGGIVKNSIIGTLQYLFMLMLESMTFSNQ